MREVTSNLDLEKLIRVVDGVGWRDESGVLLGFLWLMGLI
jgi:hypothetical protein